ncbi:MAG: ABC transporter substrate-binding protein [Acidimicrobiales bacterium]|jgi:NitT/TauT family transport system substrate-binding protein|nr:ABC transporter substrate-binding protein [Acidimicrobiales bacterium]
MTRRPRWRLFLALFVGFALFAAACGDDDSDEGSDGGGELTPISLQLQWFTQGQFCGYYAGIEQGYYADRGLDLTIIEGGVDIIPQTVVANGDADYAVSFTVRGLASREAEAEITQIAQVFQRAGTRQVSWADSGITTVADWEGKKIGNWGFGNEFEVLAAIRQAGLDPSADVELVQQQFDMVALVNREIDAAQATIYNEYAQMLETVNPDTGELIQPDELHVIDYNDLGVAMLQDALWASTNRLNEEEFRAQTVDFLAASMEGWIYCRDNLEAGVELVLDNAPILGEGHQRWMINEINSLIWPSPDGVGVLDPDLYQQTVDVAVEFEILAGQPDEEATRTDLINEALDQLRGDGLDVTGDSYARIEVEPTPGGE